MKRLSYIFFFIFFPFALLGQISVDNTYPYNSKDYLINDILIGASCITTSNINFHGDPMQLGYFDNSGTSNSSFLNISDGIVLSTGDVNIIDPNHVGYVFQPPNNVSDPDLLNVANEVPPLLPPPFTNSFSVSSINDVAILEFEFIPNSPTLSFDYAFGSLEYFEFENTEFNDVFGFFISGPGITGPYSSPLSYPNGSINLATVPAFSPDLPITVSSVNDTTPFNQQYFIDNRPNQSNLSEVKGLTEVFTATATVIPGQTYHIRLAIADGSDNNYNSFIWLAGGSFLSSDFSPTVSTNISNNLCSSPSDITFSISQDPNEEDIDYATVTTSGGSFDFSSLTVGDIIGNASTFLNVNSNTINSNLVVTSIVSANEVQAEAQVSGTILGSFTLQNLSSGVKIYADSPPDGNNYTAGNNTTVNLNNIFVNPDISYLNFYYDITSELLCNFSESQYFSISNCVTFSPSVGVSLSDYNCQALTDLTITVSQDFNEEDIDYATFTSSTGSFDFSSLAVGNIIGSANMNLNLASFNANIVVSSIISTDEIVVDAIDVVTGANLGSFTLKNLISGGVEIYADSPVDGNYYTNGNNSSITFFSIFQNPSSTSINFNFSFTSELGSTYYDSYYIDIICCPSFSPEIYYSLSEYICDTVNLNINLTQDCNEEDIQNTLITTNYGSFSFSNLLIGDVIGNGNINYSNNSFNVNLVVSTIISIDNVMVDIIDQSTGNIVSSINLQNISPSGVQITANDLFNDYLGDGDNYTNNFSSSISLNNIFVNPNFTTNLNFNTQFTSELSSFLTLSDNFNINCTPNLDVVYSYPTCYGYSDGSFTLNGSGGTGSYNYQLQIYDNSLSIWLPIGQSPLAGNFTTNSVSFLNLADGCYKIIISDSIGNSYDEIICLYQPDEIIAYEQITPSTPPLNNDGSIEIVNITGGLRPFVYSWVGPNGYTSSSEDIYNLEAGTYYFTILDGNGCSNTFIYNLEMLVPGCMDSIANNYDPLATYDDSSCCYLSFYEDNIILCLGDSIELLYSNLGQSPESFLWSTGDTTTSLFVNPTTNSTYSLEVTSNGNSCVDSVSITLSCLSFSPTVSVSLSDLNCGLTDLTINVSQDPDEVDMDSAVFISDIGSFTISSMNVGDNIGYATMTIGSLILNADLIVSTILSSSQIEVEAVNQVTGVVLGTISISNLSSGGIEIISTSPGDGNSYTLNGNSSSITFTNVFDSNSYGFLNFSSSITSERNDLDLQYFPFYLNCTDFSPSFTVSLSDLNCGVYADLSITVSQDSFEVDIDTAFFTSDAGYFNLVSLSVGDTIGYATMSLNLASFDADLIVGAIISNDEVSVDAYDQLTGAFLGSFVLRNIIGGGVEIIAFSPDDGNVSTMGNISTVVFDSLFFNSTSGLLTFTSNMISELGDVDVQSNSFFLGSLSSFFNISRCYNYTWNGNIYDSTGVYVDTFTTSVGCDSIVTMTLTINNNSSFDTLEVCDGLLWNGSYLDSSGNYIDTLTNVSGCDSIVNLLLIVRTDSSYNFVSACDSFVMNGIQYDSSGIFVDTLVNIYGCDSLVTIDLTIYNSFNDTVPITACGLYSWDSINYDTSGFYSNMFFDQNGCDSLVTIDLTIVNTITVFDSLIVCDSLFWNGNLYTNSGNYIDTVIGSQGCDSIVNLNLIVNSSSASTNFITACNSYLWFGQNLSSSGFYDTIIPNSVGCDSLTQIYLTIIQPIYNNLFINSCGPYNWNGVVFDTSGTYIDTLVASSSCDSIVIINLTVTPDIEITSNIVNVNCFGASTGSIDIQIISGSPQYTYSWSNNSTSQDINNLVGDSLYSCLITDSAGCSLDTSFFISQPTAISVSENIVNVSCFNGNDGSISLTIGGGVLPYSVSWGSTDTSNLFAGYYSYEVVDNNGCIYFDSVEVTQPNQIQITTSTLNISCYGYDDGFIEVNVVSGSGVPPYSYSWTGPNLFSSSVNNIYNLFAGDYLLTLTDGNGCVLDTMITLTQPANLPQNTNIQISNYNGFNIRCNGENNGWVSVVVSGGYEPYTYLWSNSSTSDSIYDLYSGTYSLELTDSLGCIVVYDFPLIEPDTLTSSIISTTDYNGYDISCFSFTDGAAQAIVSGGVPNYDYYWNNVKLVDSVTNLSSGEYLLKVVDKNNCESTSSIILTQPDSLYISIESFTDTCSKGVGSSIITTFGGVSPFDYLWSNGLTSSIVVNFNEGNYSVDVVDANQCLAFGNTEIFNLPSPIIDFGIFPDNQRLFDQFDEPIVFIDFTDGIWQDISTWIWDFNDGSFGSDSISYHSFADTGTYNIMLTTISEYNCVDTLIKQLLITDYNLYIPNSFTPFSTNDQLNDIFRAYGIGVKTFKMEIYTRWGQRVFTSNSLEIGWDGTSKDGKQMPVGVYIYNIVTQNIYGEEFKYHGQVKLIR